MRPIKNSPIPQVNGVNKSYTNYQEWREDITNAYGQHCVFCNDRLQSRFEVEHLVAQSLGIVSPLAWNNLFLACGPCNLAKSNKVANTSTHYLPNSNNTHLIFEYSIRKHKKNGKYACIPIFHPNLTQHQQAKSINTIAYTELNRIEQTPIRQRKMTDVRWHNRYNAYQVTKTQRNLWDQLTTPQQQTAYLNTISPLVHKTGFFSLWLNAFNGATDVLKIVINCLPNTSDTSFDANFNPIPRNPINLADNI
ncbi:MULTISPECIES: HNH endonuclease [Flavobacterium]|uniref:HNH domain-containing protein n=1 Tax=Flavobacterium hankyongi TaxID=1176532 RepID=A0ABP8ZRB5_9FLAO|nr:HNH endonuclease [Flavobacterium sp. N1846]